MKMTAADASALDVTEHMGPGRWYERDGNDTRAMWVPGGLMFRTDTSLCFVPMTEREMADFCEMHLLLFDGDGNEL